MTVSPQILWPNQLPRHQGTTIHWQPTPVYLSSNEGTKYTSGRHPAQIMPRPSSARHKHSSNPPGYIDNTGSFWHLTDTTNVNRQHLQANQTLKTSVEEATLENSARRWMKWREEQERDLERRHRMIIKKREVNLASELQRSEQRQQEKQWGRNWLWEQSWRANHGTTKHPLEEKSELHQQSFSIGPDQEGHQYRLLQEERQKLALKEKEMQAQNEERENKRLLEEEERRAQEEKQETEKRELKKELERKDKELQAMQASVKAAKEMAVSTSSTLHMRVSCSNVLSSKSERIHAVVYTQTGSEYALVGVTECARRSKKFFFVFVNFQSLFIFFFSFANVTKFPGEVKIATEGSKEPTLLLVRLIAGKPKIEQMGNVFRAEDFKSDLALGIELGRVSFQLEELISTQNVTRPLDSSLHDEPNAVCTLRLTRLDASRVWNAEELELYPDGPGLLRQLIQQKIEDDKLLNHMQENAKVQEIELDRIKTRLEELASHEQSEYAGTIEDTVVALKQSLDKKVEEIRKEQEQSREREILALKLKLQRLEDALLDSETFKKHIQDLEDALRKREKLDTERAAIKMAKQEEEKAKEEAANESRRRELAELEHKVEQHVEQRVEQLTLQTLEHRTVGQTWSEHDRQLLLTRLQILKRV